MDNQDLKINTVENSLFFKILFGLIFLFILAFVYSAISNTIKVLILSWYFMNVAFIGLFFYFQPKEIAKKSSKFILIVMVFFTIMILAFWYYKII